MVRHPHQFSLDATQETCVECLSSLYDRYFAVIPANTRALLDEAHALRYQVYCVEHAFEDPAQQVGEREIDQYDAHAVHAVLLYRPTERVAGCVRLILPTEQGFATLPIRRLLGEREGQRFDALPVQSTAEISRYAVSKAFRRRPGEDLYPDVALSLSAAEARRLAPHMSLGLIRGIARLAADQGVTHLTAAMAPALLRLLERFGLSFELLGAPVEYHGERQVCVAGVEALLDGLARQNRDFHEFVGADLGSYRRIQH